MTNEQAAEFARQIEATLPTVLDDVKTLGDSVAARLVELRAAATALPANAPAEVRHALALPLKQIELVSAVFNGAPTGKLQDLVRDLERARKQGGLTIRL